MSPEVRNFDKTLCRCCHSEGQYKNIYTPHSTDLYKKEIESKCLFTSPIVYVDKLRECFNVELLSISEPYQNMVSVICGGCIQKLQDAYNFKYQVQKCEDEFRKQYYQHLDRDLELKINVKEEVLSEDTDFKVTNDDDHAAMTDEEDHSKDDDPTIGNNQNIKLEVSVDWIGGRTNAGYRNGEERLMQFPEVNILESRPKEVEDKPVAVRNKRRCKSSNPRKASSLKPVAKRKVGRPKIVAPLTPLPPEDDALIDIEGDDSTITKERTLFLLQKDVDYKQLDDQVQCTRCLMTLKNIHCLRVHVKHVHFKLPRYACTVCPQVFQTLNLLNEHKKNDHDIEPELKCKSCDKRFNQVYNLNRHVRNMHSSVATTAKKSMARKRNRPTQKDIVPDVVKLVQRPILFKIQKDIDYKIVEDLVQCLRCEKTAANLDNLRYHIKFNHLNYARFTCPVCPETFMNSSSFTKHKFEVHNIDHRAKCNACNSAFNTRHQLKHHINCFHMLGEKYKCNECDYEGFSRHHLRRHMVKHKNVKNFHCKYCQKSFVRKSTLSFHERIHTGDKRKVCKECGEAFVQKASLNYHMAKYHPGVHF